MKIIKFVILGLLILLLTSIGCSKEDEFDIRGNWSFRSGSEEHYVFSFSGSLEMGTLVEINSQNGAGTYSVSGEKVVFDYTSTRLGGKNCHFSGSFMSENQLSGNMDFVASYPPFQWTLEVEGQKL